MEALFQQIQEQSIWEWLAVIFGLIYIWLATKNNPACWIWGILSCAILMVVTFMEYKLYADAALQAFYVIMGFYGLYLWKYGGEQNDPIPIGRLGWTEMAIWMAGGLLIAWLSGSFLSEYTPAAATHLDSFTTVFSVIATIWLVRRKYENWPLWVVVDIFYVYLYFSRGALLFGILLIVYAAFALLGWYRWHRSITVGSRQ